jgi:spore coat polysaccharide biosynthesis protein SpsF
MAFKTEQEEFWANNFGNDYIQRNKSKKLLASNLNFFSTALKQAHSLESCIEFGANIGMNLRALKLLYPEIKIQGVEINEKACMKLSEFLGKKNVFNKSIFDFPVKRTFDLSFTKGVLIHINPEMLESVYQKLYDSSDKYILVAEYYNPSPVSIKYRGHQNKLFKRDFAGEMLEKFNNLTLSDYGFVYKRDPSFPQDDVSWFLLEKMGN